MERRNSTQQLHSIAAAARDKSRAVETEESLVVQDIESWQRDGDALHLLRAIARLQDMLAASAQLTEHATSITAHVLHQTRGTQQARAAHVPVEVTQQPTVVTSLISHDAVEALGAIGSQAHTSSPNIIMPGAAHQPHTQTHSTATQSLLGAIRRQSQKTAQSYRQAHAALEQTAMAAEAEEHTAQQAAGGPRSAR